MMGDFAWVIVQAGGRGSRLRHHTWNKPKCLVSIEGRPLLYHAFERFPQARFIVIGDYEFEQLERFLKVNPPQVPVTLVRAEGSGTAAGIAHALQQVAPGESVLLMWSDLLVGALPPITLGKQPLVGLTDAFTCRWSQGDDGRLAESPAASNGIPGLFVLPDRDSLPLPPDSGEFVRWFAANIPAFDTFKADDLREVGEFQAVETRNAADGFARFFNKVTIGNDEVVKEVRDPAYAHLIDREIVWYREASALGFRRIPKVLSESPFTLQRVRGRHLFAMDDLSPREKRAALADGLDTLASLHDRGHQPADPAAIRTVYIDKTIERIRSIQPLLTSIANKNATVNGRKCRNPFADGSNEALTPLLNHLLPAAFTPIHGDPTFSNMLFDDNLRAWLIDPRGYFAEPGIYGDPAYDFAKMYYSAVGGYDLFNRRRFKLYIDDQTVEVLLEDNPISKIAEPVFAELLGPELGRIKLLHGLIWLALSGYVKDDIDSIIGAFYLGLYWLEDGMAAL